jgi:hypothetical protein
MRPSSRSRDATVKRFYTNTRRIGAIAKALSALASDEGVRADIMRATVVFLHATLEDFVRSSLPNPTHKLTFSYRSDLIKALGWMRVGPERFGDLMAALAQLAKRRHQIVHHADLGENETETAAPWTIADNTLFIAWNLAVLIFVYRLRKATGPVSVVEDRAGQNYVNARAKLGEFVGTMTSLDVRLPLDQLRQKAEAAQRALDDAQDAMRLEVEMFLDAEGNPLPGAISDSDDQGKKE